MTDMNESAPSSATATTGSLSNSSPPAQPPVDNDHVAPGAEKFASAPAPMIVPTVGRVVLYLPKGKATAKDDQPQAAIVTFVHDAHTVNLFVLGHDGHPTSRHRAHLVQPDEAAPETGGFACWMPFQIGQAKAALEPPAKA